MSAEDRREQVLDAALIEFAQGGLAGTSTEAIAARAGISQPYLFRLFPTKRELFIAAASRCFDNIARGFAAAAEGLAGEAAMKAMGDSYMDLIADRDNLLGQLQMYAACGDPDIRDCARAGFRDLYTLVQNASGAPPERMVAFFAVGMLCNVTTALQLDAVDEPWAQALQDKAVLFPISPSC
jgi:AcrR family transcriptional regulator